MMNATNDSTRAEVSLDALVASVVDEFRARQKRGEKPNIEEFVARYPEAAELLRKVLATLQLLDASLPGRADDSLAADAPHSGTLGDFRLLREVGRGGMGIVYEAEQISLGRRVALKVLPFAATLDPRQLQRFHNESRAAASLRHEHIVPVYAVGQERGVHFFAMQFVDGQTMADLIAQQEGGKAPRTADGTTVSGGAKRRSTSSSRREGSGVKWATADTEPVAGKSTEPIPHDDAYFRRAGEWGIQAAEALEHAHSLGIVHRDIKPGNLMIDAQGQLWVADFGLARRAADSDLTMSGDVLGTLRYMSPEQALAKHDLVDHRSDVYSLGATLYELLTLHAAVGGKDKEEILREIIDTDVKPLRHWDRRIPADLETIVLKALAKEPEARYATAKELAEDLRRYLSYEPIRARRPTLRQNVAKWVRRNRAAVNAASVAAFITVAVLSAAAGIEYQREQDRVTRENDRFLARQDRMTADASRLLDEAANQLNVIDAKLANPIKVSELLSNIDGWRDDLAKARAAWQHGNDLASSNSDVQTLDLVERLRLLNVRLQADEFDWEIAKKLDDIRLEAATVIIEGEWDPNMAAPKYERLFRDLGFDWKTSQPAQITSEIRQRRLRYVLLAALDDWASKSPSDRTLHLESARLADPNPWRDRVRDEKNWKDLHVLELLAREVDPGVQSPHLLLVLAKQLRIQNGDATKLLRSALMYYSQDFWLHFDLGGYLEDPDQEIGCFQAALALRPTSGVAHNNLGVALNRKKDHDGAVQHLRKALDLGFNFAIAHNNLGNALWAKNDLDGAVKHYQKAINRDPKQWSTYLNLANVFRKRKDLDGAILHLNKALEWNPNGAVAHGRLGDLLVEKKDFDNAIQHYHKALDLNPKLAGPHTGLGHALRGKKDLDVAVQHYCKALDLDPKNPWAYAGLGLALGDKNDLDGSIQQLRKAIELNPNEVSFHNALGAALKDNNESDAAIKCYRKALDLDGNYAQAHNNLGIALRHQGKVDDAVKSYRMAIALEADYDDAYYNLTIALKGAGRLPEVIEAWRSIVAIREKRVKKEKAPSADHSKLGAGLNDLAMELNTSGEMAEARQLYERAIYHQKMALQSAPDDPTYRRFLRNHYVGMTETLVKMKDHVEAAQSAEQAARHTSEAWKDHFGSAKVLAHCILLAEQDPKVSTEDRPALTKDYSARSKWLLIEAVERAGQNLQAQHDVARFLAMCEQRQVRDPDLAVAFAKKVVERAPKAGAAWNTLGLAHYRAGDWKAAIEALQTSMKLRTGGDGFDFFFLAMAHQQMGEKQQARARYEQAVAWMEKGQTGNTDMVRFRAEAAEVLGIKVPTNPKKN